MQNHNQLDKFTIISVYRNLFILDEEHDVLLSQFLAAADYHPEQRHRAFDVLLIHELHEVVEEVETGALLRRTESEQISYIRLTSSCANELQKLLSCSESSFYQPEGCTYSAACCAGLQPPLLPG